MCYKALMTILFPLSNSMYRMLRLLWKKLTLLLRATINLAISAASNYGAARQILCSATQIGSTFASTSSGSGDILEFTGMSLEIPDDVIAYFWITGNVAAGATPGRTISVDEIAGADFQFTDGDATGTADESGIQTITASGTPTLNAGTLTDFGNVCVNTTSTLVTFVLTPLLPNIHLHFQVLTSMAPM